MMDRFTDLSGIEVGHCTIVVYFENFLCLSKRLLCLTVTNHSSCSVHLEQCSEPVCHFQWCTVENLLGSAVATVCSSITSDMLSTVALSNDAGLQRVNFGENIWNLFALLPPNLT